MTYYLLPRPHPGEQVVAAVHVDLAVDICAAGVFFAFHRATWENIVLILLTGYLIAIGAAGMTVYTALNPILLGIAALFGIPAAIVFLLQRQHPPAKQNSEA